MRARLLPAAMLLLLGCSAPPRPAVPSPAPTAAPSPSAAPVSTPDRRTVSDVPCKSVKDCWLDPDGKPEARPKAFRNKPIPRGDCGSHLLWLRNELSCEQDRCTATFVGDAC